MPTDKSTTDNEDSSSLSTGAIVGIGVSGGVVLIGIGVAAYFYQRGGRATYDLLPSFM